MDASRRMAGYLHRRFRKWGLVMARTDWDIYGTGLQSIVDVDGSLRCQLAGLEWMLYNGVIDLGDSQIIADMRRYGDYSVSQGGLLLRADATLENCYYLQRQVVAPGDGYRLTRHVDTVMTILWQGSLGHAPEDWVRVRFRIDGWQLSVYEWVAGEWSEVVLVNDLDEAHVSGYVGLFGLNTNNPAGMMLYDNIEIAEKA